MKNTIRNIIIALLIFIFIPFVMGEVQAASLNFDKATVSVNNGDTFSIAVTVDPGSDSLNSVDSYVLFDSTFLTPTTVTAGTLFPTVSHDESTAGKVYIAGLVDNPASPISSAGTLATITFKALQAGTVNLSFDCNFSKVIKNDINASNVMVCSQNGTSAVTIATPGSSTGGSSSSSSSGGSSSSGTSQSGSTPTTLPKSGSVDNLIRFAVPGIMFFVVGGVLRMIL